MKSLNVTTRPASLQAKEISLINACILKIIEMDVRASVLADVDHINLGFDIIRKAEDTSIHVVIYRDFDLFLLNVFNDHDVFIDFVDSCHFSNGCGV